MAWLYVTGLMGSSWRGLKYFFWKGIKDYTIKKGKKEVTIGEGNRGIFPPKQLELEKWKKYLTTKSRESFRLRHLLAAQPVSGSKSKKEIFVCFKSASIFIYLYPSFYFAGLFWLRALREYLKYLPRARKINIFIMWSKFGNDELQNENIGLSGQRPRDDDPTQPI